MPARHLIIKGEVQGVFYRASARKVARATGVTGWIRNTPDGHVEAVVNGHDEELDKFVSWCRQGPADAVVTDVIISAAEQTEFDDFTIR